jgi:hypothetical protein
MGWTGLSAGDVCRAVKDRTRNGGRTPDQILEHLTKDPLVQWAWQPGGKRDAIPLPYSEFLDLVRYWVATGAACP